MNRGYYAIDVYIKASLKRDKKKKTSHNLPTPNLHFFVWIWAYDKVWN